MFENLEIDNVKKQISPNMSDSLKQYLIEIRKYEQINKTPGKEIELGLLIQDMFALKERGDNNYTEQELERIRLGEKAYLDFFHANLRMVVSIARRYEFKSCNIDFESIIQFGNIGLMRAIRGFDPTRGYKFSTYAYPWIKQKIVRGIANTGLMIRLPLNVSDKLDLIKRRQNTYIQTYGKNPTRQELAELSGYPIEEVSFLLDSKKDYVSLNAISHTESSDVGDLEETCASDEDVYDDLSESHAQGVLFELLGDLSLDDGAFLLDYYDCKTSRDFSRLAKKNKIHKSELNHKKNELVKKLRKIANLKNLGIS